MNTNTHHSDALAKKNARTVLVVFGVVVFMVGLAFASVPLYDLFCRVTGWGGTTQVSEALPTPDKIIDRVITVRFDANTSQDLPWAFKPDDLSTSVRIGARGFINYTAENTADVATVGTALFNVTPLKAGKYFHKVQCFCFDEQVLQSGQRVDMPVMFYVDPALHEDRNLNDVTTITLSYTFFKAESDELDVAMEAFYNQEDVTQ